MSRLYRASFALTAIAVAATFVPTVFAQRNSTLTRLQRDTTADALNLTEEQQEELKKVTAASKPDFKKYLAEMRELEGDAREAKRKQFAEDSAKLRENTGLNALKILNPSQRKQFSGMLISEMGAAALNEGAIVADLKLTDDQKAKIKTTLEERRKAIREQGVRASRDERDQLSKEWDTKVLANLTDAQRSTWKTLAAASAPAASSSGGSSRPSFSGAPAATKPAEPKGTGVISFGGPPVGEDGKKEKLTEFSFNSDGAAWDDVLETFAEATELTLDMHDTPPGSFKHLDANKYTPRKALDIMNGYLLREGFVVVQKDNFLIVWAFDNGLPPSLVPEVTPEQLIENYSDVDNQLLTVSFKMESGDVEQIANEIDILLDPYPFIRIAALTASNTLVVTDLSSNLRKVKKLIDAATGKISFKKFPIVNIDVSEANDVVRAQLGLPASNQNVSENRGRRTSSTQAAEGTNVTPELRTNSLLVSGTQQQLKLVESILAAVDVEGPDGPYSRGSRVPYLEVYTMTASNVMEVGKTIEALMPGKIVNEDGQAKKLHIKATQAEHEEIRALIAKLDKGGGSGGAVAVISLNNTDVMSAAQMLSTMFVKESDGGPVIQSDAINQRLIIRGNPEQIEQIRSVLKDIGEDGIPRPKKRGANDNTIRIPLGGRDPDKFMEVFKSMWQGPRANPIIIKVPSESNPVKDSILPGRQLDEEFRPGRSDEAAKQPAKSFRRTTTQTLAERNYAFTALLQEGDDELDLVNELNSKLNGAPQDLNASDPKKPELLLTVQGDTLVVLSTDNEALSRAEEMMELLNQTMPAESRWTVFYLTSADCTETAAMLEQLFPTSSIGTGAGGGDGLLGGVGAGLSSFGDSLMGMTGLSSIGTGPQTLRIIPETRSNSLWVTGPKYLVNQVEAMLKTLDKSELPQSQRDLLPRQSIRLKYASASVVGEKIKELFKTYTEAQRQQGGNNNPLAMMMGGGAGGGQNRGTPVRLTVTVDESTNNIYCACSNQLYERIRDVAEQMDRDMQMAKPGIKMMVLKDANALAAARMIQSLMPRVTVSSDGNNARRNTGSNNTQDAAAKAAADRAAAFQRAAAAGAFGNRGGGNARGGNTGRGGFGGGGRGTGGGGRGRGGR